MKISSGTKTNKFVQNIFIVMLCFPASLTGQVQHRDEFSDFFTNLAESSGFDGSALVGTSQGIIYQNGTGIADRSWSIPNSENSRYLIGSLTKPMTAVLVLEMIDKGEINLNDTLDELLPDYTADYTSSVTVEHLLKHRSGIPNFSALPGWFYGQFLNSIPATDFAADIAQLPLEFAPGAGRVYSNSNYLLLGLIIEAITHSSFTEYLSQRIFEPLQMGDSGVIEDNTAVIPNLAANYINSGDGVYRKGGYVNYGHFIASASVFSTVGDLYKWGSALQGGALLSEEAFGIMFDPDDPIAWDVSLVQMSANSPSMVIIGDGELEGYVGMMMLIPDFQISVILLNNNGVGYDGLLNMSRQVVGYLLSR